MTNTTKGPVKLDWTQSKSGFAPLETDTYHGVLTEVAENESKSSGQPQFMWTFTLTDQAVKNRKYWHYTSLQPEYMFNLRNTCEWIGIDDVTSFASSEELLDYIKKNYLMKRFALDIKKAEDKNKPGEFRNNLTGLELLDSEEARQQEEDNLFA